MTYSLSEYIKTVYSYIITKLILPQADLIRRPLYVRGGRLKSINGGKRLTTGRFCRIELNNNNSTLVIGDNCKFGDFTHIVANESISFGDNVLIASKCFISDTSHGSYTGDDQDIPSIPPNDRKLVTKPVTIGNNVWIGENAVILPGARIGDGCIIGANTLVSKDIPQYSIVIGSNKIIKQFNSKTNKWVVL